VARFDLLRKNELRIQGIALENANLNEIAAVVADMLGIDHNSVLVTDVQGDTLAIDILESSLDAYNIVGKSEDLLQRLSKLPGVSTTQETSICSEGMLGWIALDYSKARPALKRAEGIAEEIRQRLSKRAIVFSTGFEVAGGQVKDTNTPIISQRLEAEGYSVTSRPTLRDDELLIAANLRQAADDGYGLVITTGGVGAEVKDRTIEAVLALDPEAATPYICKYQKGVGRHRKDGVRIAVGQAFDSLIVALPGPNDEVKSSLNVLVKGLASGSSKHILARDIATVLRKRLQHKTRHRGDGD
jgi:molybdenum cofactor synthesis domain-containing protein